MRLSRKVRGGLGRGFLFVRFSWSAAGPAGQDK
ncbi:hypothetical protein BDZ31_004858, partial [Conexibacter arvalis]|nr:hypothetical protein [Conexibacter arvalis]